MPKDLRGRYQVTQWLMWQMGGLGPMCGQNHHFGQYAPEKIPYAIDRYVRETGRLYGVLNNQLKGRDYICGDYSIADMACWPWIVPYERQNQKLEDFPNVKAWFERMKARPAVAKGWAVGRDLRQPSFDEEAKKILFGQSAATASR